MCAFARGILLIGGVIAFGLLAAFVIAQTEN